MGIPALGERGSQAGSLADGDCLIWHPYLIVPGFTLRKEKESFCPEPADRCEQQWGNSNSSQAEGWLFIITLELPTSPPYRWPIPVRISISCTLQSFLFSSSLAQRQPLCVPCWPKNVIQAEGFEQQCIQNRSHYSGSLAMLGLVTPDH